MSLIPEEHLPEQPLGERIKSLRGITRTGGYKEVPEELIREQAEKIGLEESEIPKVVVRRGLLGAYAERLLDEGIVVFVPRRQSKRSVPEALSHEFAHIKLGHIGYGEERSLSDSVRQELEARKLQRSGKLNYEDLIDVASTFVLEEGCPRGTVTSLVMKQGSRLGVSRAGIVKARRWLKWYWPEVLR